MTELDLPRQDPLVLAVDKTSKVLADQWARFARDNSISTLKFGLELGTAEDWAYCAELANDYQRKWLADAKFYGIKSTVARAIENIVDIDYPPMAVTVPIDSGKDTLEAAQEIAGEVPIFGVTVLTTIGDQEVRAMYGMSREELVVRRLDLAEKAGLKGAVASANEIGHVRDRGLLSLICGTRSPGVDYHEQANVRTPAFALRQGADFLEIGREVTSSRDPVSALQNLRAGILQGEV